MDRDGGVVEWWVRVTWVSSVHDVSAYWTCLSGGDVAALSAFSYN